MKISEYEIGYAVGMIVGLFFVFTSMVLIVMSHGLEALENQRIYLLGVAIVFYALFYAIGNILLSPHQIIKGQENKSWGAKIFHFFGGFTAAVASSAFLVAGLFMFNKPF